MFPDKHLAKFDGGPLDGQRRSVDELTTVILALGDRGAITIYCRATIDSFATDPDVARAKHPPFSGSWRTVQAIVAVNRELRAAA